MTNRKFDNAHDQKIHDTLTLVYNAMVEKGYNPLNQLKNYIYTEDPVFVTTFNGARQAISEIDRDDLFVHILKFYMGE